MQRQKSAGSAAGSVKSKNSDRSVGKYKRVSNNGGSDESLFGSQPAAVCSRKVEDMIRQPPAIQSKSGIEFDSVVITTSDLKRIRLSAAPPDETEQRAREAERMKADGQARAAKARKDNMIYQQSKSKLPTSDLQKEDEETMSILQEGAQRAKDENLDPIKGMNRMIQYAKCVTIRDGQLMERQMIIKEAEREEAEFFQCMEGESLKYIKLIQQREEEKHRERLRGAQIIQMQIQQHQAEKMREAEMLDQERQAMLKKPDEIRQQVLQREQERRLACQRMLQDAAATNTEQLAHKAQLKHQEEEENMRIAAYVAERARKEQARQDEIVAEARRKAEEVALLRAMQEKHADSAASFMVDCIQVPAGLGLAHL
jgi:hypothetical protein